MPPRVIVVLHVLSIVAADPEVSLGDAVVAAFGDDGADRRLGDCGGEMRKTFVDAHLCHKACGQDGGCHQSCPKPWKPFVEACQKFPAIRSCYEKCGGDSICTGSCSQFDTEWMQQRLESNPHRVFLKAEVMCPRITKSHACHSKCQPGDDQCHRECSPMFDGPHDKQRGWQHASNSHKEIEGAFLVDGLESLTMLPLEAPRDRFNGRFIPTGKLVNERPIFVQDPQPGFAGRMRVIAWFGGHWRYYSYYDDTRSAGTAEKCTFMVKSDAMHPADVPHSQQWTVHPSAMRYLADHSNSGSSLSVSVQIYREMNPSQWRVQEQKQTVETLGDMREKTTATPSSAGKLGPDRLSQVVTDMYNSAASFASSFGHLRMQEVRVELQIHV